MELTLSILSAAQTTVALILLILVGELAARAEVTARQKQVVRLALFTTFAVFSLSWHMHIPYPDVFVDQRGAAIAIATLFGGVWGGVFATSAEIVTRLVIGGATTLPDLMGIVSDLIAALLVLKLWVRDDSKRINLRVIMVTGFLVGLSEALALLYIQPFNIGLTLFKEYGMQLLAVQFLSTLLFGWVLKTQDDHQRNQQQLERKRRQIDQTLHQVVGALSNAMALRDRTTAGHEQKVSEFAVAVGKKMGMNEDQLEGLHLAATVHDVGQIQIPTEILTRTRALRAEEFDLIKEHSKAGYDILKDVQFPWPVAEIIYQHHENIDGSGYPRGLKQDEILLEAKIIRVCDSLEAMTSHRPFRKAFSIEDALAKLQANSGKEYDPAVVATCIEVLKAQQNHFLQD